MSVTVERWPPVDALPAPLLVAPDRPKRSWLTRTLDDDRTRGRVLSYVILLTPLACSMALWGLSLGYLRLNSLGRAGLVPALPLMWYAALSVLIVGAGISCWSRRSSGWVMAAYILGAVVVLYVTIPAVAAVPRPYWIFKHIGVTRLIQARGGIDPSIDIFTRWPGFFALAASFAQWVHLDPLSFAGWAEPFFAAVEALMVAAVAFAVSGERRVAGFGALIFTLGNWVGETYYSPQAAVYPLYLAVLLVLLRGFPAGRRAPRLSTLVARIAGRAQTLQPLGVPLPWSSRVSVGAVLGLDAVIVATHELTPYVLLMQLGVLIALGMVRAWRVFTVMAVLTVGYLGWNIGYINAKFGLVTSFNPIHNLLATRDGSILRLTFIQANAGGMLSALLVVLMLVSAWRLARLGEGWRALALLALATVPAGVLLAQDYGGEATGRVFLFSSPWRDVLIALGIQTFANRRLRQLSAVAVCAVVAAMFVPAFYGSEELNMFPRAEVTASQYFYAKAPAGSVLMLAAPDFPTQLGARYPVMVSPVEDNEPNLATMPRFEHRQLGAGDVPAVVDEIRAYSRSGFLVFATSGYRFAELAGLTPSGALQQLETAVAASPDFRLWYRNGADRIYELVSPSVAAGTTAGLRPLDISSADQLRWTPDQR